MHSSEQKHTPENVGMTGKFIRWKWRNLNKWFHEMFQNLKIWTSGLKNVQHKWQKQTNEKANHHKMSELKVIKTDSTDLRWQIYFI